MDLQNEVLLAVMMALLRSVVVKNELSWKAKLLTSWSIRIQTSPMVMRYEL